MKETPRSARVLPLLLAIGCPLAGCLENEEEIQVYPDGAVDVSISAKGRTGDLADGWPVPLGGPWEPRSPDTERWLKLVGADTGSPFARERAQGAAGLQPDPGQDLRLAVRASFPSVSEMPRFFSAPDDAYRTAYLERSAALEVRRLEGRTVFVFERTFHGRDLDGTSPIERAWEEFPEELRARFEAEEPVTPAEMSVATGIVAQAYGQMAEDLVRAALVHHYAQGDASLPPAGLERLVSDVRAAVSEVFTSARLAEVYQAGLDEGDGDDDELFTRLEQEGQDALRGSFTAGLVRGGVPERARNAALFALEWMLTSVDHSGDLRDEKFSVRITMPGTIVGGNYDALDGNRATWSFEGQDLVGRDRVLRVVSVTTGSDVR